MLLTSSLLFFLGLTCGTIGGATIAVYWCLRKMDVIEVVKFHTDKAYDRGYTQGRKQGHQSGYQMGLIDGKAQPGRQKHD